MKKRHRYHLLLFLALSLTGRDCNDKDAAERTVHVRSTVQWPDNAPC